MRVGGIYISEDQKITSWLVGQVKEPNQPTNSPFIEERLITQASVLTWLNRQYIISSCLCGLGSFLARFSSYDFSSIFTMSTFEWVMDEFLPMTLSGIGRLPNAPFIPRQVQMVKLTSLWLKLNPNWKVVSLIITKMITDQVGQNFWVFVWIWLNMRYETWLQEVPKRHSIELRFQHGDSYRCN